MAYIEIIWQSSSDKTFLKKITTKLVPIKRIEAPFRYIKQIDDLEISNILYSHYSFR